MTKPIGCYAALGAHDPPAWVTFGKVPEWTADRRATFRAAADLSARRPGFWWVLHLGTIGVEAQAASTLNDVIDAGLWPHIRAVEFLDEPLSSVDAGVYGPPGLETPRDRWRRLESGFAWLCDEYAALDELYPKRWTRIWSDHCYNEQRQHGPQYWRPCPPQVQTVGLTSYHLGLLPLFVDHALATQPRPVIVTPRWFSSAHDPLTADMIGAYPALLARPRVVAACGYLWNTDSGAQQGGLAGLADLPECQTLVAASLGVAV